MGNPNVFKQLRIVFVLFLLAGSFLILAQSQETIPGSLTEIKQIKLQIEGEKQYSASLRTACETYYAFVSNHKESVLDYINFFKRMMAATNDPDMKNVFRLRYIRGLFISGDSVAANTNLKQINSSSIAIPEEKAYYKLLLTYSDASWDQAKLYFEDAINVYEKNKISTFELYSLYNNFGIKYAEINQKTAISLSCRALSLAESFDAIYKPIQNLHDLIGQNQNLRLDIENNIQEILKTTGHDKQILIIGGLLYCNFWRYDVRKNRKYTDKLYSLLESSTPSSQNLPQAWLIFAAEEHLLKNYADAEAAYNNCIEVAKRLKNNEFLIEAMIGRCFTHLRQRAKAGLSFRKDVDELLVIIAMIEEPKQTKASWYTRLAFEAIRYGDIAYFDKLADLANNNDGGLIYARRASIELTLRKKIQLNRNLYIKIASKITDSGIRVIGQQEKLSIQFNLDTIHAADLAKKFAAKGNESFVPTMFEVSTLLGQGTRESMQKAIILLDNITATDFSLWGIKMTSTDAKTWILNEKLNYYLLLNDLNMIRSTLEGLENLYPSQCSTNFSNSLGPAISGNMGNAYVVLGQVQKGIPFLVDSLPKVKGTPLYPIFCGVLGQAHIKIEDPRTAIQYLRESVDEFKKLNMTPNYIRISISLAIALNGIDEIPAAEKILDEILPITRQNGYIDDIARIYQLKVDILRKNRYLTRNEKIKRIIAMQRTCLSISSNPALIANALYLFAKFKFEQNIPYEVVINDIELYFKYQKLFRDAITSGTHLSDRDAEMKDLLFRLLAEANDVQRIDYWNKVFERDRTRAFELQSQQTSADTKMLSLLTLISKFENAQQILAHEQSKKESEQDKLLIQKAFKLKQEIEQQYELAKKKLSARDLKLFDALLSDNFIIHPDSLSQMSSVLPERTACLQFLNVGEKIIAYIAVKDAPPFTVSISLKEKGLTKKQFSRKLIKIRNLLQSKTDVSIVMKDLSELYGLLFSELEQPLEKLKVKSIVVNASGILRYVPLATLYDGKKYLIEKYQVTNITGLDLIRLSKNIGTRTISDVKAAIFADPDGSLPAGRNEGQSIAKYFANKKLYLGAKASLTEFESMMGNVNFVHLATHAVLDPNEPGKSYIQFADGKKWYYSDMMGFNIKNVDSIALSACETAVSEKSTGGEIEGMAYQLLKKSPSGSVLASFWKVDDTATAMLMSIYYKHVTDSIKASHTLDRGGALREAQLKLLRNPDTSHPYYWAAFTLFGDFR